MTARSSLNETVHPYKSVAYADDSYVVITGESFESMVQGLKDTIARHFDWLGSIGMTCNLEKTELISFCKEDIRIQIGDVNINSSETMKVLGVIMDRKLSWEGHVEKIISGCKKITFALRYLRNNVDREIMKEVIRAQAVSKISYACSVWYHRLTYHLRTRLRSAFYKVLRNVLKDFEFKLNRSALLRMTGQESPDVTLTKRSSLFLFKIITTISPTELATTILSKCYYNERNPGRLSFSDTSRFGKACISNNARIIVDNWNFDWLFLTPDNFKKMLASQLNPLH